MMTMLWIVVFVQGVVLAVLVTLYLGMLRRIAPVIERAEALLHAADQQRPGSGLPVGHQVPPFVVLDQGDNIITSAQVFELPSVVLFFSAYCKPCQDLARQVRGAKWEAPHRLVVILAGPTGEPSLDVGAEAICLRQTDDLGASQAFQTDITPVAFLVDEGGYVRRRGIPSDFNELLTFGRQELTVANLDTVKGITGRSEPVGIGS